MGTTIRVQDGRVNMEMKRSPYSHITSLDDPFYEEINPEPQSSNGSGTGFFQGICRKIQDISSAVYLLILTPRSPAC